MTTGTGMLKLSTAERLSLAVTAIGILSGCGSDSPVDSAGDSSYDEPYAVVSLDPGAGDGGPVAIAGARIVQGGAVQVLVEGGACMVPTRLAVDEGADSVEVQAYAHDNSGSGGCTMQIVPWFVPLNLESGLGDRSIVDAGTNEAVRTVDCTAEPSVTWCKHPVD